MVRNLGVRDVGAGGRWHMAMSAVGLVDVVFGGKVTSVLFRRRFVMRIVTTGAGHGVSRFPLAHALRQRLNPADAS